MSDLLRGLGLILVLAGAVSLLAAEKVDLPLPVPPASLLGFGVIAFLAGLAFSLMDRASRAVHRRRCMRCGSSVRPGEVYCTTHFRETIDRLRDSESA